MDELRPNRPTPALRLAAIALALAAAVPARADVVDEAGARQRIAQAGYTDVAAVHEGNLGEWMAEARKGGQHVLVVVHRDGTVAPREQVALPPVPTAPLPAPAKP